MAGLAFDPERLLWRPGKKLISIPSSVRPAPPAVYIGLLDNLELEVSGDAYERVRLTRPKPEVTVDFPPLGYRVLVTGFAYFDATGRKVISKDLDIAQYLLPSDSIRVNIRGPGTL
jgi:hypothetical protein